MYIFSPCGVGDERADEKSFRAAAHSALIHTLSARTQRRKEKNAYREKMEGSHFVWIEVSVSCEMREAGR